MFTVFSHAIGQASASPLGLVAYVVMIFSFTYLGYVKYLAKGKYDIRRRGALDPEGGLSSAAYIKYHAIRYRYIAYGGTLVAVLMLGAMTVDNLNRAIEARIHAADVQRDTANIARVAAEGARDDAERGRRIAERQVQATQALNDQQARDAKAAREQAAVILQSQTDLANKRFELDRDYYNRQLESANAQTKLVEEELKAQIDKDQREADAAKKTAAEARARERAPRWVVASANIPKAYGSGSWENHDICQTTPAGWKATGEVRGIHDSHGMGWARINWPPQFRNGPHEMCMGFGQNSDNLDRVVSFEFLIVPDDT